MTSDRVWLLIPLMTMMNSYHYSYYYCYDYDNYPSYCCCSILLNVFLSLDEHDLLHLETSLIFSVPQKDYSNGKKKHTLSLCYLHPVSNLQSSNVNHFSCGHHCHLGFFGFHERGSITWTWCSCRLILPFMMTSSVPQLCTDYAHYWYAPCWFISAFITSFSDCLLSQQDLVSNIFTDVVDKSYSDSNWSTALLHQ